VTTRARNTADTSIDKIDYATPFNDQSGSGSAAYTFALADGNRITSSSASATKTFIVPPQVSVTWPNNTIIRVVNYGAGALTIAGGSGVTVTNAAKTVQQYESASVIRTGENAWTLVPFSGGIGNADFTDAASGTYTDGGIDYKWKEYTATGTITIAEPGGFADILVIGGGAGGGNARGGGGGAGGYLAASVYLAPGTATVVVGAGGAGGVQSQAVFQAGVNGVTSRIGSYYAVGGGAGGAAAGGAGVAGAGNVGGSGGGGGGTSAANVAGGAGTSNQGNTGGTSSLTASAYGGGGGGGAGANGNNGTGTTGGNGGAGLASSITNSSVTRAGGGGGGTSGGTAGSGGSGGGGAGTTNNTTATSGTANTGGGAGGGGFASGAGGAGGNGGSGIVIIRVRTS